MDNHNPDAPSPSKVSVEDLLSLLNSEIEQVLAEQSRSGWTMWAVLGALAGMIWLGLSQWESGGFKATHVLPLFLIFSFGIDFIMLLYNALSMPWFPQFETDRFYPVNRLVGNRFLILLMAMRAGLLIYLAFTLGIEWFPLSLMCAFYGFRAIELLGDLIYDFFKIPLRITSGGYSWPLAILFTVITLLAAYGTYGILSLVLSSPDLSVSDFRMASLLTAGSFLIIMVAQGEKNSPLLSSLINIRRYLTLKEIDVETALRHIDITLSGMQVADILQEHVRRYLYLYDQMNIEYSNALKELEAMEVGLPDMNTPHSEEQAILIEAALKSCQQHKKSMSEFYEEGLKEEKRIHRIARWIHGGSPRVNRAIDEVLEHISKANKEFFDNLPRLNEKRDALIKCLEAIPQACNSEESTEENKKVNSVTKKPSHS